MNRRAALTLIAGAAAWPLAARAERAAAVRRVGLLSTLVPDNSESRRVMDVFMQALQELGWRDGQNVRIEQRWSAGDTDRLRADARAFANPPADVVLAVSTPAALTIREEAPGVPIVFIAVTDPIGSGLVGNLPRPGGNVTGFINLEGSLGGKWLSLLKEIVPGLTHAGFMFNPETAPFAESYLSAFEAAAPAAKVTPMRLVVRDTGDIERAIAAVKAQPVGGLIVMPDTFITVNRLRIIEIAAHERLPVVYPNGPTARLGGLIAYGIDNMESTRGAAAYIDRILRGEKAGDLPVQAPTKFELVINLRTARGLGIEVPATLQALADEVIE
jgi:putative tryptophan/tyrosine transport system substrate-binding protein